MSFWRKRREVKLYKQWVERAGLPPEVAHPEVAGAADVSLKGQRPEAATAEEHEPPRVRIEPDSGAVTHPGVTGNMLAEISKGHSRLRILYILLGVALVILCVGLIFLALQC